MYPLLESGIQAVVVVVLVHVFVLVWFGFFAATVGSREKERNVPHNI